MYESIRGVLQQKTMGFAIVECGGLAYRLFMPISAYALLPACGEQLCLYLSQVIREQDHFLYAFIAKKERDLFEELLSSPGIGPKTALGIVGHLGVDRFYQAIQKSELTVLSKLPGIGKKTAEKLIIEMRDKVKIGDGKTTDAISVLLNLGYPLAAAHKAVQHATDQSPDADLSQIIAQALSSISS